ncbi:MAG: hypothetical protein N4A33_07695 [Bacteriovoracaceae bacterium]|jgi:hypothetical protein|nr:hypothetical protein [Bacteriovoracaceae bacterium]
MLKTVFILLLSLNAVASPTMVLIPGAASSGKYISIDVLSTILDIPGQQEYFYNFDPFIKSLGYKTIICPFNEDQDRRSLNDRAHACHKIILEKLAKSPNTKFHIIGHSMGGLIGRKLLEKEDINFSIETLTTISTPHRGAALSHFVFDNQDRKNPYGVFLRRTNFIPEIKKYITDLRFDSRFISNLTNKKKIPIYSVSNYKTNYYNIPFEASYSILKSYIKNNLPHKDWLNDGIIETSSMNFGTHLGTIKADHMETACVLYTKYSKGCKNIKELLKNHLKALY